MVYSEIQKALDMGYRFLHIHEGSEGHGPLRLLRQYLVKN